MYVKKFASFCQALKDANKRKLVPFFCLTVYKPTSTCNDLRAVAKKNRKVCKFRVWEKVQKRSTVKHKKQKCAENYNK